MGENINIQPTSIEAYKSIQPTLGDMQRFIYKAIQKNPGMSNHDISRFLQLEINKVTPRVKELRTMNLVIFSHYKKDRKTGRKVMCWTIA